MYTQDDFKAFVDAQKYPPNEFQSKILHALAFEKGNLAVKALAGSGKTTLLIQCAYLLKEMGVSGKDVLFMAFNKSIRDELNKRLPFGFEAINSHSYGNRLVRSHYGKAKLDKYKFWNLVDEMIDRLSRNPLTMQEIQMWRDHGISVKFKMISLISVLMLNLVDVYDIDAIRDLAYHHSILGEGNKYEPLIERCLPEIPKIMRDAEKITNKTGQINFDEMLYIPAKTGICDSQYKYILVDEAQDLNRAQQALVKSSLAQNGRIIIVGDPNQSIYGFMGADVVAFNNMIEGFNAKVLPLSICYRCPTSVLDYARVLVPSIQAKPNAEKGIVRTHVSQEHIAPKLEKGDMVLSRTNAPLISMYFTLIAMRKPAQMIGREIHQQLQHVLDKIEDIYSITDMETQFTKTLDDYFENMQAMYSKVEGGDRKADALSDIIGCLVACYIGFQSKTMEDYRKSLDSLFPKNGYEEEKRQQQRDYYISLSSVHRSKGLESKRVIIIEPDKMPLIRKSSKPWEVQQEMNIIYVAMTRAMEELIICGEPPVEPKKLAPTKESVLERQSKLSKEETIA